MAEAAAGAETVGDPAAMRTLAGQLISRADVIASTASSVTAPLDDMTFEGNAATRLRGTASEVRSQVAEAASQLRGTASQLMSDADKVERMNQELADAAAAQKPDDPSGGGSAGGGATDPADTGAGAQPLPTDPAPEATV